MANRAAGRVRVVPTGRRRWVRITPERARQRMAKPGPSGRLYPPPKVQRLLKGFIYG